MANEFHFTHNGEELIAVLGSYADGNLLIAVLDAYGAPYATLSVNMPESTKDAAFIKDYSENAAVAKSFLAQVPATPTGRTVQAGYVAVSEYRF